MARKKRRKKRMRPVSRWQQESGQRLGNTCFQRGDYPGAIQAWRPLVKNQPDSPLQQPLAEAHFRYAMSLIPGGNDVRVLSELQQAVQYAPRKAVYRYHLGLAYHRRNDYQRAADAYRAAVDLEPNNSRYEHHLDLALSQMGPPTGGSYISAAIALQQVDPENLRQFREAHPEWESDEIIQGIALALEGDFTTAKRYLNKCSDSDFTGIASYYLGLIYAQEDKLPSAIKNLEAAARDSILEPRIRSLLINVYKKQAAKYAESGDEAKAAALWRKVVKIDPDDPAAVNIVSSILEEGYDHAVAGDFAQAMRVWQRAINLEIATPLLLQNYAIACDRSENYRVALHAWSQLAQRWEEQLPRSEDPATQKRRIALVHRRIGEIAWHIDAPDLAEEAYQRVLEFTPDDIEIHLRLISIEIEYGDPSEALRQLKRLARKHRDHVPLYEMMITAYMEEENFLEALRIATHIVELDPKHSAARNLLQGLGSNLVSQMRHQGKFSQAERLLQQLLKVEPDFLPLLLEKMALLLRQRKLEDATAVADQVLEKADDKIETRARVGSFYWFNGYPEEAEVYFEAVGGLRCEHSKALLLMAVAYLVSDTRKAGRYFGKLSRHPDVTPEDYVQAGLGMAQSNRSELAHRVFERGLKHFPDSIELLMAQITVALMDGDFGLIDKVLRKACSVARKQGNYELVDELESIGMALRMQRLFGGSFPDIFGDLFDEFDEDDEPF